MFMKNSHYADGEDFEKIFDEVQDIIKDYTSQNPRAQSGRLRQVANISTYRSSSFQTRKLKRVSDRNNIPASSWHHYAGSAKSKYQNRCLHVMLRSLTFVFILVLLISVGMVARNHLRLKKEQEAFEKLAVQVFQASNQYDNENSSQPSQLDEVPLTPYPQTNEYQLLYNQNPDFIGWLQIDNTIINYPVMYTPDRPEYYLRRAFDGSDSESGTLFVGDDGGIDNDLFIIYGHNMDNHTMFGTLDDYADPEFYQEHPTIEFTTVYETRKYEVFAAIETRVMYTSESGYRYYEQAGELNQVEFDELIDWIQANALYQTGISPNYGDQIVILSTCSYHTANGRFIIVARKVLN